MRPMPALPTNVVSFRPAASRRLPQIERQGLLDAVYAASSLALAADDVAAKRAATRLQLLGFLTIDEVQPDGRLRRLSPSQAFGAAPDRAWRISRRFSGRQEAASLAGA